MGRTAFTLSLGSISTAGWTGSWFEVDEVFRIHAVELTIGTSTATISGTVLLEGSLSTGSTAPRVTLASYTSTQATHKTLKASTNNVPVSHVRIKSSTGMTSTSTAATVTVSGKYAGVP